jgi:hypothetical protein
VGVRGRSYPYIATHAGGVDNCYDSTIGRDGAKEEDCRYLCRGETIRNLDDAAEADDGSRARPGANRTATLATWVSLLRNDEFCSGGGSGGV